MSTRDDRTSDSTQGDLVGTGGRPTLEDVARKAGFALRTAKKVISGNEYVPEATRRRVLQAAAELGYRKNPLAAGLSQLHEERIAIVYAEVTGEYFRTADHGFRRFADEYYGHGVEVRFATTQGADVERQAEVLRGLARDDSVSCVCVQPLSTSGLDGAIAEVVAAGKPVVTFGSDAPGSKRLAYVGPDAYRSGRIGGQILSRYLGASGEVLILSSVREHQQTRDRRRGFLDLITERYPDIRPVDLEIEDSAQTAELLRRHLARSIPDGIFATFDAAAIAGHVVEDLGATGVTVVGFDLSAEVSALMRRGTLDVTLAQDPEGMAYQSLKVLFDLLYQGITPRPLNHTAVTVLTSECLDPDPSAGG